MNIPDYVTSVKHLEYMTRELKYHLGKFCLLRVFMCLI